MNTLLLEKGVAGHVANPFNVDKALEYVMKEYKPPLASYAYQLLKDHDAVNDILQEIWIDVYQRLKQYGRVWLLQPKLRGWLGKAVHNASINYLKQQRRTIPFSMINDGNWLLERRTSQFEQPDLSAAREELIIELEDAVDHLQSRIRATIHLHYFYDLSLQEIADRFKCPLNTIKSDMHRGKSYLRTRLRARGIHLSDLNLWISSENLFAYKVTIPLELLPEEPSSKAG